MSKILDEYDEERAIYEFFAKKIEELLAEVLSQNSISFHSISCRVKERSSLARKIDGSSTSSYDCLSDVTDICGIRVIIFFQDDANKVDELIHQEFTVDEGNSVNKADLLDPDRFGYLSMHHIVSLSSERSNLSEYKKFIGLKAEVQTRTVVQHAWAEIEHDLGYKCKEGIPNQFRRKFSRLASLLELADEEFMNIRDGLTEYQVTISKELMSQPENLPIDQETLIAFVNSSEEVKVVDNLIVEKLMKVSHISSKIGLLDPPLALANLTVFPYVGITNIKDLEVRLKKNKDLLSDFAVQWVAPSEEGEGIVFNRGISLFYLLYVESAKEQDVEVIREYQCLANIEVNNETLPSDILKTYMSVLK